MKNSEHQKEAKERWGDTEAYKESESKTSKYTEADWEEITAEASDITIKLANLMEEGKSAADVDVQAQVERWFRHINDRFYTCPPEIFRALGDGYVTDSRFTEFYDGVRVGLAKFKRDAMCVYSDKLKG